MNKKKLSVVMAGAMLATSVAPVLADTSINEIPVSQADIILYGLKTKMESKLLSKNANLESFIDSTAWGWANTDNESVYGVQLFKSNGDIDTSFNGGKISYKISDLNALKSNLSVGKTIKVYERGTNEFLGQTIAATMPTVTKEADKFTATDIKNIYDEISTKSDKYTGYDLNTNPFIKSAKINETQTSVTITLHSLNDINDATSYKTITLNAGESKVNFNKPLDKDGNLLSNNSSDINKFESFLKEDTYTIGTNITTSKELESIKIVADESSTENKNLLVSDLYDGVMINSEGTALVNELQAAKEVNPNSPLVKLEGNYVQQNSLGIYEIKIGYYKNTGDSDAGLSKAYKITTIRGFDEKEATALFNILKKGNYKVGAIGGSDRYETAVRIAQKQGVKVNSNDRNHIVLVNGTSLVDGLAAAPFAAIANKIDNASGSKLAAPVLLTKSDKLPESTKSYIETLTDGMNSAERKNVKIDLVGGESVLTSNLEKELKDMGFTVVRYGGDNREETSVEVAEKVSVVTGKTNAFVVGANGEADAMSIGAVASQEGKETPIIVSSVHGLTKDSIKFFEKDANATATILGGETVFSKADENKIKETKDEKSSEKVSRIAGKNRQETNAKIIDKYYYNSSQGLGAGVIVVKDGMNNKNDLVDALSAANLAAYNYSPVVLATDKLSDDQLNSILKAKSSGINVLNSLYQIGNGVSSSVMSELAKILKVENL